MSTVTDEGTFTDEALADMEPEEQPDVEPDDTAFDPSGPDFDDEGVRAAAVPRSASKGGQKGKGQKGKGEKKTATRPGPKATPRKPAATTETEPPTIQSRPAPAMSKGGLELHRRFGKDLIKAFNLPSQQLKQIGDPSRTALIMILAELKSVNVTQLCELCGKSQPAISHHLALLRHSGLAFYERNGKQSFYELTSAGEMFAAFLAKYLA